MNDVHAFADRAEHGVVAVEPRRGHRREEKLGAAGVAASVGHRENTGFVVLEGERRWFARDLPTGPAGTGSPRHRVF